MKSFDKEKIMKACRQLLQQRIATAEQAMNAAQEASNSEDKSSAGDKYETSRAMGQLDRDMNARQLAQAKMEMSELAKIDLHPPAKIRTGSLVICGSNIYFIAIGLGAIRVDGNSVIVISPKSPLAMLMIGKTKGEHFIFNHQQITVENIL